MSNKIEPRLAYYYAQIDPADGMCLGVLTSNSPMTGDTYVQIDSLNEDYMLKFYNRANGQWYEDAAFTIPWSPSN